MKMRILIFEDDDDTRKLLSTFLRSKGLEVLDFATPVTCELVARKKCECPRHVACADAIVTDMNMPGMTGLELVRFQLEKGCHAPPQNKAVISAALSVAQEQEFKALGCRCLRKPFKLNAVLEWIQECEKNIPLGRELEPIEELWKTAGAA